MRFIRSINTAALSTIAGEMLNQEYGKRLFQDGQLVSDNHQALPEVCYDGVKILMKPNFGLLYVDDRTEAIHDDYTRWVKLLTSRVEALSSLIPAQYDRSKQFTTVECGEDGFTSMKIKINYAGTKYFKESAQPPKSNLDRAIYAARNAQISSYREKIGLARFTWIVYPLDRIYHGIIAGAENPDAHKALLSYFTLVYDPTYVIRDQTNPQNDNIMRDLTLVDVKYARQVLPLYSAGEIINEDLITRLNAKTTEAKTPETPTDQPVLSIQDDSVDRAIMSVSIDNMIGQSKYTYNLLRYPGYIAGLHLPSTYRIMYCPKRLGAIELIKQLGRFPLTELTYNNMKVPIRPITQDVYDINDPVIDNTLFPNDVCAKCLTPLYDDIYLTYNTVDSPSAKAYCPVCMHSCFDNNGDHFLGSVDTSQLEFYSRLYYGMAVLAKTKYHRSYNQVIDMIANETIKEILRGMYSKRNTVVSQHGENQLLFIDCQANQIDFNSTIYVGFTFLNQYFDYCYHDLSMAGDKFQPPRNTFMGPREGQIFDRACLYPLVFISC